MITAAITNAGAVADRFAALAPAAQAAILVEAGHIADDLLAAAERNLSGAVLKPRTGTLRASLRAAVEASPLAIRVTANTPYAAYQEYGFTGIETVRAHLRRQTQAFGRPIGARDVAVRAFTRQVDYPAHSFLRSALDAIAPAVPGRLAAALSAALQP
jgi:hypothetical protein